MTQNRRTFLAHSTTLASALAFSPLAALARPAQSFTAPDPIAGEVVKEYVGVAHKDLDRTKAILDEHPLILNASWDWGKGDFETAIGAAGHVGRRDIAEYLLGKGARPDIFVLTMLGETAIVKAMVERFPDLLHAYGPHGYTLLHHAQRGGEQAQDLYDFFTQKGLTETFRDVYEKKK